MRVACLLAGLLWIAAAQAEALYRLPWPDGQAFMFTQVSDGRITSHFTKAMHHAVDIAMPAGMTVLAAREGVVEALESREGEGPDEEAATYEGNFVRVRHEDGTAALYAHLKQASIVVSAGERVKAGQRLALSGASGDVVRPHLHFAVSRLQVNASGWAEEVSLPIRFYVGVPPIEFAPRAAMTARANYSSPAKLPHTASEHAPLVPWRRPTLDHEAGAWLQLLLWLAIGLAGMAWFWRFSREP